MSLANPETARDHAARRYFKAETKFRLLMIQADAAHKDAEREGARRHAEWCHRAALAEIKDLDPREPA